MNKISIIGIGGITALGTDINDIWEKLKSDEEVNIDYECEYNIPLVIKKNLLRRMDRFSHMGVYVTTKAIEDLKEDLSSIPKQRIGTIFSTGYGPMKTNIEFCRQVVEDEPDFCSPTVFSNTVANACLGHICMLFKFTGVSTMLMGSNNIGYSVMLMEENKADYIVVGSIEEPDSELIKAFKSRQELSYPISECALALILKRESCSETNKGYCNIETFSECNLGIHPFKKILDSHSIEYKIRRTIENTIKQSIDKKIDAIICSGDPTCINNHEIKTINQLVPECKVVDKTKELFGETLGSTLNLNVAIAALCIKNQLIPKSITNTNQDIKNPKQILVCGYDISGNYTTILVSK